MKRIGHAVFWWAPLAVAAACLAAGLWLYALSGFWRLLANGLVILLLWAWARRAHRRAPPASGEAATCPPPTSNRPEVPGTRQAP